MSVEVESKESTKIWHEVKHQLPQSTVAGLVGLTRANKDVEICGFILADATLVMITNVDPNPSKGFEMDKDEMMKVIKGKTPIYATFHSHPSGRKWPSDTDGKHMSYLYQQGCPWRYLIVTTEGVFEFEHRDRS